MTLVSSNRGLSAERRHMGVRRSFAQARPCHGRCIRIGLRPQLILLAAVCVMAACSSKDVAPGPRVVTAGAGITEIVYALGAGDQVVGVDRTSIYPPETGKLENVGLPMQLGAEGVLSLKPTLLIGDSRAGPAGVLDQIREAGVKVELFEDPSDGASAVARIRAIAKLVGKDKEADPIVATLERELAEGKAIAAAAKTKPKTIFLYARGHRTLLVGGADSPGDAILQLVQADNVMRDAIKGFQPASAEAIVAAQPDVIVITSRGLESLGGVEGLLQVPGIDQTPAGKNKKVIAVDDLELLGFGPRLGKGVIQLAKTLHQ